MVPETARFDPAMGGISQREEVQGSQGHCTDWSENHQEYHTLPEQLHVRLSRPARILPVRIFNLLR